jgi:hypothetical protein
VVNSKLAPNSLKLFFLFKLRHHRERLNPLRIKHEAQPTKVKLMEVIEHIAP